MTKTFCDRCGKEIKKVDHLSIYAWITHRALYGTLRMIGSKSEEGNWKTVDAYVCPECEDSYIHWFMNPEPPKEENDVG